MEVQLLELECYRNYLAIVEAGSFSGAAEIVKMTQPALSKQLKILESQYGTKLIITNRGNRKLTLTEAGKLFYQKAKYICSIEESIHHEIQEITDGTSGTLRISVANSRAKLLITNALKDFSKLYPQVNYEIYEGGITDQAQQILSGITELGILSVPVTHEDSFEILFRRREELTIVYHKDSKWFDESDEISIQSLQGIPLSTSAGCYNLLKNYCSINGLTPQILSVSSTRHTALQWAREKSAVAIVPAEPNEFLGHSLISKPILDPDINLCKTIVKAADKPLSPVAQKFVEFYAQNRAYDQANELKTI